MNMNDDVKRECQVVRDWLEARLRKPYDRDRCKRGQLLGPDASTMEVMDLLAHVMQRTMDQPFAKNGVLVEVGGWLFDDDRLMQVRAMTRHLDGDRHYAELDDGSLLPVYAYDAMPPSKDRLGRVVKLGDQIATDGSWETITRLHYGGLGDWWVAYTPTRSVTLAPCNTRPAPKDKDGRVVAVGDEIYLAGTWEPIEQLVRKSVAWIAYTSRRSANVSLFQTRARVVNELVAIAKNGVRVEVGMFLRIDSTWRRVARLTQPRLPVPEVYADVEGLPYRVAVANYDGGDFASDDAEPKATTSEDQPRGLNQVLVEVGGALRTQYQGGKWIAVTEVSHHLGDWFAHLADGSLLRVKHHDARPAPRDQYKRLVVKGDEVKINVDPTYKTERVDEWATIYGIEWRNGVAWASVKPIANNAFDTVQLAFCSTRPAKAIGKNGIVAEIQGRIFDGECQYVIQAISYSEIDRDWRATASLMGESHALYCISTRDVLPPPRDRNGQIVKEGDYTKGSMTDWSNPIKILRIMAYTDGMFLAFVAAEDAHRLPSAHVSQLETKSASEIER